MTVPRLADVQLRTSTALLTNAAEIADIGIWEADLVSKSVYWSPETFGLYGFPILANPRQPDLLWPLANFKHPVRLQRQSDKAIRQSRSFRFSDQYTRPDGSIRVLVGAGAPVSDASGEVVRLVGVIRDITQESHSAANFRRLSDQLLQVRGDEQRRMGRELHETTSQTLAALKMTISQIGRSIPTTNGRVRGLIRSSEDLARNAAREVRFVSSLLHPPLLAEAGLPVALRAYGKLLADRGGTPVTVHIPDDFGRLEKEIELTIFRVAQEGLTNVFRHAHASHAFVRVKRAANRVTIDVKDDGAGFVFHSKKLMPSTALGVGLVGMCERVEQMGGRFHVITAPGKGTTIRASLPIHVTKESTHGRKKPAQGRSHLKGAVSRSSRRRSRHRAQRPARLARTGNRR